MTRAGLTVRRAKTVASSHRHGLSTEVHWAPYESLD